MVSHTSKYLHVLFFFSSNNSSLSTSPSQSLLFFSHGHITFCILLISLPIPQFAQLALSHLCSFLHIFHQISDLSRMETGNFISVFIRKPSSQSIQMNMGSFSEAMRACEGVDGDIREKPADCKGIVANSWVE